MLRIVPLGVFANGFNLVTVADEVVAGFRGSLWRESGEIAVADQRYEFRRGGGRRFTLDSPAGTVATGQRRSLWSSRWDVVIRREAYELVRAGWLNRNYELRAAGAPVGWVAPSRGLRRGGTVELPAGLAPAAQAFVVAIVLTQLKREAAAAGGAAAASTGAG